MIVTGKTKYFSKKVFFVYFKQLINFEIDLKFDWGQSFYGYYFMGRTAAIISAHNLM